MASHTNFHTSLEQVKTLEVDYNVIMLNENNFNPLETQVHTRQACLHSIKRCWYDSSKVSHKTHTLIILISEIILILLILLYY